MSFLYRTTDALKWGAGLLRNLLPSEVDNNFWAAEQRLTALETSPPSAISIADISVAGKTMTITMTDASQYIVTLPVAALNFTGDFIPAHNYFENDLLIANDNLYLVLQDHTSGSTFVFGSTSAGPLYQLVIPFPNAFDIGFWFPGKPGTGIDVNTPMFALRFTADAYLLTDLPNSLAGFETDPVDAAWTVNMYKNATLIGSYTFDTTASVPAGSFSFLADVQFNAGDVLRVIRPSAIDSTAKGFTLTLAAKRGLL